MSVGFVSSELDTRNFCGQNYLDYLSVSITIFFTQILCIGSPVLFNYSCQMSLFMEALAFSVCWIFFSFPEWQNVWSVSENKNLFCFFCVNLGTFFKRYRRNILRFTIFDRLSDLNVLKMQVCQLSLSLLIYRQG